jgi:hypothetical protein
VIIILCIEEEEEEEEETLFTNYGPTRGMHIHILYNYLKHNTCLTKTKIQ